ncbi:hypothetical protein [Enterococcus faecalis]|uniref:hypothetical protein n=1 Tax=Enterococcus faecalis TaxID=1351 RepID=UPI003B581993
MVVEEYLKGNGEREVLKEGSVIQNISESKHEASIWIQDAIDKLKSFNQLVADGHMLIIDGDYNVSHPTPDKEQVTFDSISLTINYVETNKQTNSE